MCNLVLLKYLHVKIVPEKAVSSSFHLLTSIASPSLLLYSSVCSLEPSGFFVSALRGSQTSVHQNHLKDLFKSRFFFYFTRVCNAMSLGLGLIFLFIRTGECSLVGGMFPLGK